MCPAVKRQVETGDINVPTIWAGCHEDSALNFTLPYLVSLDIERRPTAK